MILYINAKSVVSKVGFIYRFMKGVDPLKVKTFIAFL